MRTDIVASPLKRALLVAAGSFFVALGTIGILVPLLPTTPFLLLAAYCYMRSSKRLHEWLLTNRWFGEYLRNYQEGRGVPVRAKAGTLALLWATIAVTMVLFVDSLLVRGVLLAIAVAVTVHVLMLKTLGRTR